MTDTITDLEALKLFINGKSVDANSGKTFKSVNPYTGQPWAIIADGSPEDIDLAVDAARAAFNGEWGRKSGFERAAIMRDIAAGITANAEPAIPSRWADPRCGTCAAHPVAEDGPIIRNPAEPGTQEPGADGRQRPR